MFANANIEFLEESFYNDNYTYTGERYLNLDLLIVITRVLNVPMSWDIRHINDFCSQKLSGQCHWNNWICVGYKLDLQGFLGCVFVFLRDLPVRNSINLSVLRLNSSSNGMYLLVTLASRFSLGLALGQVAAVQIVVLVSRATGNISHNTIAGSFS